MTSKSCLINKINDYLQDRQKNTNFGTCIRCDKKVYWSTTKIASHIRSGHCSGASEDEVKRFRKEFVYDSPKNLVHKSIAKEKDASLKRELIKSPNKDEVIKKQKEDVHIIQDQYIEEENNDDNIMYEVEESEETQEQEDQEKLEIVYVQQEGYRRDSESNEPAPASKEEKFISAVYPQFKGKTKLQLIDDLLDLKRQNELLQAKVKTYENTILKLL